MAIDITPELSTIASEPRGSLVKQAIYDALDKLSKGGGPGPEPKPIDPNEFLPGSAHVRYYYSIAQGRIGISTANDGEVIPIPTRTMIQYWPQSSTSSTSTRYQTVVAYPAKECILLAVVMHRYQKNKTHANYTIHFFDGETIDNSWGSPVYETYACGGGSTTVDAEQYVSVFRKNIQAAGEIPVTVRYTTVEDPSYNTGCQNNLALCLIALYDVEEMLLIDNALANGGTDLTPMPLNITRANGNQRLYIASTWTGVGSPVGDHPYNIWFTNDVPGHQEDYIYDFREMPSGDNNLAIAFDADGWRGKPWVVDRPYTAGVSYDDDINYLSLDIVFSDEVYVPDGFAILAINGDDGLEWLTLRDGSLLIIHNS